MVALSPQMTVTTTMALHGFNALDHAAAAHPGSKGSQYRSTTRSRPGVEDENRGFPITARAALPVPLHSHLFWGTQNYQRRICLRSTP